MDTSLAMSGLRPPRSARRPLRVLLVLDPGRVWRWQHWLAQALADDGHAVGVQFIETRDALPSSLRLLMALEARS
jgi:hypothetical protein